MVTFFFCDNNRPINQWSHRVSHFCWFHKTIDKTSLVISSRNVVSHYSPGYLYLDFWSRFQFTKNSDNLLIFGHKFHRKKTHISFNQVINQSSGHLSRELGIHFRFHFGRMCSQIGPLFACVLFGTIHCLRRCERQECEDQSTGKHRWVYSVWVKRLFFAYQRYFRSRLLVTREWVSAHHKTGSGSPVEWHPLWYWLYPLSSACVRLFCGPVPDVWSPHQKRKHIIMDRG